AAEGGRVAPSRQNVRVARDLGSETHKCLEIDPKERYPSAGALAEDLRRHRAGKPTLARARRRVGRPGAPSALAAALFLAAAGATVFAVRANQDVRRAEQATEVARERTQP